MQFKIYKKNAAVETVNDCVECRIIDPSLKDDIIVTVENCSKKPQKIGNYLRAAFEYSEKVLKLKKAVVTRNHTQVNSPKKEVKMIKEQLAEKSKEALNLMVGTKHNQKQLKKISKGQLVNEALEARSKSIETRKNPEKPKKAAPKPFVMPKQFSNLIDYKEPMKDYIITSVDGSADEVRLPVAIEEFTVLYGTLNIAFKPVKAYLKLIGKVDLSKKAWKDIDYKK